MKTQIDILTEELEKSKLCLSNGDVKHPTKNSEVDEMSGSDAPNFVLRDDKSTDSGVGLSDSVQLTSRQTEAEESPVSEEKNRLDTSEVSICLEPFMNPCKPGLVVFFYYYNLFFIYTG